MLDGKATLYLISALLVAGLGWALMVDRPGLRVEYFPLNPNWEGEPIHGGIGEPQVAADEAIPALVSEEIFSARWQGWLLVDVSGNYRFHVDADEDAYLQLDGLDLTLDESLIPLDRGHHRIEIGFNQTRRLHWLQTQWTPPGGQVALLPVEQLHTRRPVFLSHVLRRGLSPLALPYRSLVGLLFVLAGLFLLHTGWRKSPYRLSTPSADRTAVHVAVLGGLFVACWIWTTHFTAPLMGGDDVAYLHKALFPTKGQWFYNRYVHVYLLKAFVWIRDGDGFLGSRTYWSFMFSVTVSALAVACSSLGSRLQLRTLAVTLFVLASQTSLFGRACGGFADFSSMMFVTVAVAVYLHGLSKEPRPGRFGWHELAIGALTVAASKSKETGIILAWLPLLFLWSEGRIDFRGFARKIAYWVAGVAIAWLLLMSMDAWLLGDFWYSVNPDIAAMKRLHVTQSMQLERSITRWTQTVWSPNTTAANHALRYLWILALAAPVVATLKRKRVELRILFLMPLAYLSLLMAVHARAPHIFSTRYFFTILPICCLAAGATFNFLGLEERSWKELLQPRGLRKAWPALMVILVPLLFGPSFVRAQKSLAPRLLAQRGELILYPWNAFQHELGAARPETIVVSPELWRAYRMVGQLKTRQRIAQIFFRREDLEMWQHREIGQGVDYAIAAPNTFRSWRRQIPGLRDTAVYDPSGRLALVQPNQARQARTN